MTEARVEDGVPTTAGWFVTNARGARWMHHEAGQEDFLILRGEGILIIEGCERALKAWDLVHCPPRTPHTIVASGAEPALILAVGARKEKGSARYPVDAAALRHGAGVPDTSTSATDVYAGFGEPRPGPAPNIL
jgi:uncharacterized cupin superfamily protein